MKGEVERLLKYGSKEGEERKAEIITGLKSRPFYGDQRWGIEERSKLSSGVLYGFLRHLRQDMGQLVVR